MTDNDPGSKTEESVSGIPYAGVSSIDDAVAAAKSVSSQIYEFIGVRGKGTEPGPGVGECEGKDPKKYFQVYHPWGFTPAEGTDNDVAMQNLKEKLNTGGWILKDWYVDNSANKNQNLVADNDSKKASVRITAYSKREQPSLGINVVSGCYQIPEGEEIDHF